MPTKASSSLLLVLYAKGGKKGKRVFINPVRKYAYPISPAYRITFLFAGKTCNRCESRPLFYLLLRDELGLGGALNAEKKSNLLVTFASSGCFRSSNDVFIVVSSLKIFGLCTTKRNRAMIHVCTLAWLLAVTFEKGEVRSINWKIAQVWALLY